jgi:hypothetical protein
MVVVVATIQGEEVLTLAKTSLFCTRGDIMKFKGGPSSDPQVKARKTSGLSETVDLVAGELHPTTTAASREAVVVDIGSVRRSEEFANV